MSVLTIILLLLILSIFFGGINHGRDGWGYYGWSPLGLVIVVLLVMWLVGAL
jgi:hypothetical protein